MLLVDDIVLINKTRTEINYNLQVVEARISRF